MFLTIKSNETKSFKFSVKINLGEVMIKCVGLFVTSDWSTTPVSFGVWTPVVIGKYDFKGLICAHEVD